MQNVTSFLKRHRLASAVLCVLTFGVATTGVYANAATNAAATAAQLTNANALHIVQQAGSDAQAEHERRIAAESSANKPSPDVVPAHVANAIPTVVVSGATGSAGGPTPSATAPMATPAGAGAALVPLNNDTFYQLQTQKQNQLQLLLLDSKIADLRKHISEASNDQSLAPPSVIVAPPANMTPQSGSPSNPSRGSDSFISVPLPDTGVPTPAPLSVTSVLGVNGSYTAQIVDHGVDCTVGVGNVLSDGWRVDRIAPSTVVLVRGRVRRILHVGG